jgi:hypothetical protein
MSVGGALCLWTLVRPSNYFLSSGPNAIMTTQVVSSILETRWEQAFPILETHEMIAFAGLEM